jgi:hypothetical protein
MLLNKNNIPFDNIVVGQLKSINYLRWLHALHLHNSISVFIARQLYNGQSL